MVEGAALTATCEPVFPMVFAVTEFGLGRWLMPIHVVLTAGDFLQKPVPATISITVCGLGRLLNSRITPLRGIIIITFPGGIPGTSDSSGSPSYDQL